jgi:hypothetical protein
MFKKAAIALDLSVTAIKATLIVSIQKMKAPIVA